MDKMVVKDIRKDTLIKLNDGSVGRSLVHILIKHYCKSKQRSGSEVEISSA